MGEQLVGGAVRTHTTFIKFTVLHGHGSWFPEVFTVIASEITTTSIMIMKRFEIIARTTKMWHRDAK